MCIFPFYDTPNISFAVETVLLDMHCVPLVWGEPQSNAMLDKGTFSPCSSPACILTFQTEKRYSLMQPFSMLLQKFCCCVA